MDVNILEGSVVDRVLGENKLDWQTFCKTDKPEDPNTVDAHVSKISLMSTSLDPYLLLYDNIYGLIILPKLIPNTHVYVIYPYDKEETWRVAWKRK